MRPGSIFWFGANVSTGYEVPFDNHVLLLIFKGQRKDDSTEAIDTYLRGLQRRLDERHRAGEPFYLSELPHDHPARSFARSIGAPLP